MNNESFSTKTIESVLTEALELTHNITPETPEILGSAFQAAKAKYGNLITRSKLNERIPVEINQDNVLEVFLDFLLGEGDINPKSFKMLVLKELGIVDDKVEYTNTQLEAIYQIILYALPLDTDALKEELDKKDANSTVLNALCGAYSAQPIAGKLSTTAARRYPKINGRYPNWSAAKFFAFCAALKGSGDTSLDLSRNRLDKLSEDQWTALGAALKYSGVTSLDLSWNCLDKLSEDQWTALGAALKYSGVTSLNLRGNHLDKLSEDQWTALCTALKDSRVTSLDLSGDDLDGLSDAKWVAFGIALKDSVVASLGLRGNHLNKLSADQWAALGTALKGSGVKSLNLGWSHLDKLSADQWTALGTALKGSGVTSLNLSGNNVDELFEKKWPAFCAVLKDSDVTSPNLSGNNVDENKWPAFCAALKDSDVTSLNLSWNNFDKLTKVQWAAFGIALKDSSVTSLDLSNSKFDKPSKDEWTAICVALKDSGIMALNLRHNLLAQSQPGDINKILKESFHNGYEDDKKSDDIPTPISLYNQCLYTMFHETGNAYEAIKESRLSEEIDTTFTTDLDKIGKKTGLSMD